MIDVPDGIVRMPTGVVSGFFLLDTEITAGAAQTPGAAQ